MKRIANISLYISAFLLLVFGLSSCQVIGDIFKAGVWVGVAAVFIVIGLVIWAISKAGGSK